MLPPRPWECIFKCTIFKVAPLVIMMEWSWFIQQCTCLVWTMYVSRLNTVPLRIMWHVVSPPWPCHNLQLVAFLFSIMYSTNRGTCINSHSGMSLQTYQNSAMIQSSLGCIIGCKVYVNYHASSFPIYTLVTSYHR
jgi:hypothetical protein